MKSRFILLVFVLLLTGFISQAQWTQVGDDLTGNTDDLFGHSVAMSDDGQIVAVGAPIFSYVPGYIKTYQLQNGNWVQMGATIEMSDYNAELYSGIALNGNGSILAVSILTVAIYKVIVFQFDGTNWVQLGQILSDQSPVDTYGYTIALSDSGHIIAIGSESSDTFYSKVKVFELSGNNWTQLGQTILGDIIYDGYFMSIDLSGDGTRMAVGFPRISINGYYATGKVKVFDLSGGTWIQAGQDISLGNEDYEHFGSGVSISENGNILAIGVPGSNVGDGQVRIYDFANNDWTLTGQILANQNEQLLFGNEVELSDDGSKLVVGTGNIYFEGYVSYFENNNNNWTQYGNNISTIVASGSFLRKEFVGISADASLIAFPVDDTTVRIFYAPDVELNTQEFTSESIVVSPNPVTHILSINTPVPATRVTLFDSTGKRLFSKSDNNLESINLSLLQAGIYFVKITTSNNQTITKKIIKK